MVCDGDNRSAYGAAGRRTVMRSFAGDQVYSYDSVGRVISADNPGSLPDEAFSCDDLGNRTGGGEQYDGAGRLTARNGFTHLSDREGRVTSRIASNGDTTEFGWSDDGRLESITLPDGRVQQVKYEPLGRRIVTADGSGGTLRQTYGLDPNAVAEHTGGDVSRMTFALGYDQPLAMTTATASVYFGQDALSSVTSITNGSGDVVGRYGYDTYGQITSHTGQDGPYTYTGGQYNPQAGIYHYRARWYEPGAGRFWSQDPVPAANQYWYADGNPICANDPRGEMATGGDVYQVSVMQQAMFGAGYSSAMQFIRCGWDTKEILTAGASGLAGGLLGGVMGKWVLSKIGGVARTPRGPGRWVDAKWAEAKTSLFIANLVSGGLSTFVIDQAVDEFDPLKELIAAVAGGGTAAGAAKHRGGATSMGAAATAFVALATEIGQALATGPDRC